MLLYSAASKTKDTTSKFSHLQHILEKVPREAENINAKRKQLFHIIPYGFTSSLVLLFPQLDQRS